MALFSVMLAVSAHAQSLYSSIQRGKARLTFQRISLFSVTSKPSY